MTTFVPVPLRVVAEGWTSRVPSPAHDALTPEQRRAFLAANPDSYLAVTRSPEDLVGSAASLDADELLALGATALAALFDQGAFDDAGPPTCWVYQLELHGHVQTGLVGGIALDDYRSGELRVHERVRTERTAHLAKHLAVVGHQSSPIAVAHRSIPAVRAVIERTLMTAPRRTTLGPDGLRQRVWPLGQDDVGIVVGALADAPTYIIDGHHRAAAGAKHQTDSKHHAAETILVAAFADDELQNRAFHRWLQTMTLDELIDSIGDRLQWRDLAWDALDARADDEVAIYGDDRWIALRLPFSKGFAGSEDQTATMATALANLDPLRLDEQLLQPILGIDSTVDVHKLGYRPGSRPISQLASEIDDEGGVLLVTRPVEIDLLLDAADAGLVMPPKSTYFEPKVRSGVFIRSVAGFDQSENSASQR